MHFFLYITIKVWYNISIKIKKAEKLYMSKPISTKNLKELILRSDKPLIKIQLLLRTLPEHIRRETLREDYNMKIIKDLANKYTMVQKLSEEII
tara:strand:+ start:93 stop:374 length:282 start_codon:yes stop_codon:yes gene_type:complete